MVLTPLLLLLLLRLRRDHDDETCIYNPQRIIFIIVYTRSPTLRSIGHSFCCRSLELGAPLVITFRPPPPSSTASSSVVARTKTMFKEVNEQIEGGSEKNGFSLWMEDRLLPGK